MLLSSIHENTLSVYYTALDKLNFDDQLDTVPTSSTDPVPLDNLYSKSTKSTVQADVVMKDPNEISGSVDFSR